MEIMDEPRKQYRSYCDGLLAVEEAVHPDDVAKPRPPEPDPGDMEVTLDHSCPNCGRKVVVLASVPSDVPAILNAPKMYVFCADCIRLMLFRMAVVRHGVVNPDNSIAKREHLRNRDRSVWKRLADAREARIVVHERRIDAELPVETAREREAR